MAEVAQICDSQVFGVANCWQAVRMTGWVLAATFLTSLHVGRSCAQSSEPRVNLNGPLVSGGKALFESLSWLSGSSSGENASANSMQITSDTLAYRGNSYVSTLHLDHNFGGVGTLGSRAGLDVSMIMRASTSNIGNTNQFYVGIADYISCGYADNGSNGFDRVAGQCVALNPIAYLGPQAKNYYTLNSTEVDVFADAGSSSAHTFGILNVKSGTGPQGEFDDAAEAFASGDGHPSWKYIFQLGKTDSPAPTSRDTTVLGCVEQFRTQAKCEIGYGIDFRNAEVVHTAFASKGFEVDGRGRISGVNGATPNALGGALVPGSSDLRGGLSIVGGVTTATIEFSRPFSSPPFCIITGSRTSSRKALTSITNDSMKIEIDKNVLGESIYWHCIE